MANNNNNMIYKLQLALNRKGYQVLVNRTQFYSEQQQRPVTKYVCSQSRPNLMTGKNKHVTLFEAFSTIQMVLFLRNLWFMVNKREIPQTNHIKGADKFEKAWAEARDTIKHDEEFWAVPKLSNEIREAQKAKKDRTV